MKSWRTLALAIITTPVLLNACTKCYTCDKFDYCTTASYSVADTTISTMNCSSTAAERAAWKADYTQSTQLAGFSVSYSDTEGVVAGQTVEICDKSKKVSDQVDNQESMGFNCESQ